MIAPQLIGMTPQDDLAILTLTSSQIQATAAFLILYSFAYYDITLYWSP